MYVALCFEQQFSPRVYDFFIDDWSKYVFLSEATVFVTFLPVVDLTHTQKKKNKKTLK